MNFNYTFYLLASRHNFLIKFVDLNRIFISIFDTIRARKLHKKNVFASKHCNLASFKCVSKDNIN